MGYNYILLGVLHSRMNCYTVYSTVQYMYDIINQYSCVIEITGEMQIEIERAFNPRASGAEILNECNRFQIKRSDVLTLNGNGWLNDEVIAFAYCIRITNTVFKSLIATFVWIGTRT